MDDFGSGYSSLNTLKDVPVDVLKLDMGFLDAHESSRGGLILASIVRMARWLNLPVIAEGVETQKQAAYLASIGCEYMQGYLFSRPVDRETFERMLMDGGRESVKRPIIENLQDDASEFWNADSPVTHFFNSYVGAAAIAEYDNRTLEIARANHQFAELFGMLDDLDAAERIRKDLLTQLLDEDRAALHEAISATSICLPRKPLRSRLCAIGWLPRATPFRAVWRSTRWRIAFVCWISAMPLPI